MLCKFKPNSHRIRRQQRQKVPGARVQQVKLHRLPSAIDSKVTRLYIRNTQVYNKMRNRSEPVRSDNGADTKERDPLTDDFGTFPRIVMYLSAFSLATFIRCVAAMAAEWSGERVR